MEAKILVAIFHKEGKDNDNFEKLKKLFSGFDLYIPHVDFYGNKWRLTRQFFVENNYDSLFVICSDVTFVCGNIFQIMTEFANNKSIGVYGFGTIDNYTFNWLGYDNIQTIKEVPFIEGYCFGINKMLVQHLQLDNVYGYGIDVEIGYKANLNGLKCILCSHVCISHAYGKSYSNQEAQNEYRRFLINNSHVHKYLRHFNVSNPLDV